MQEPKIHSAIVPFLPSDHWLLEAWSHYEHFEGDKIQCEECGYVVYSTTDGTSRTWVESGRVIIEGDEPPEPQVMCLRCFASLEGSGFPVTREWWALTDDGGPQTPETVESFGG